ncbi:MAG: hypothetical protein IJR14_10850 [Synergistaceae bacterium]|nr:hypothetical protein [Synergistaceae bacterium]
MGRDAGRSGRPRKKIDRRMFEVLCRMQCTLVEMAELFGCSEDTLRRWCQREYEESFAVVFAQKGAAGRISLRRKQWRLASKSPAMAIFLGKNVLGQTDRGAVELTGPGGGAVQTVQIEADLSRLTKDELMDLDRLLAKAGGGGA